MITTETIIYPEEYWANSHISVGIYHGGVKLKGKRYIIVDKEGKNLYECTEEDERKGRYKEIPPGEPADLILEEWQPIYKALGRDKFFEYIKYHNDLEEAKKYVKSLKK